MAAPAVAPWSSDPYPQRAGFIQLRCEHALQAFPAASVLLHLPCQLLQLPAGTAALQTPAMHYNCWRHLDR